MEQFFPDIVSFVKCGAAKLCSGVLWASTCATNIPNEPQCMVFAIDISTNPASVTLWTSYTPEPALESPFYLLSASSLDTKRHNLWIARDCRSLIYVINLENQGVNQTLEIPDSFSETPCLMETVYDPSQDLIWGILSSPEENSTQLFVSIDPDPDNFVINVISTLSEDSSTGSCCSHPPQEICTIDTINQIYYTNFVGNSQYLTGISTSNGMIVSEADNGGGMTTFAWDASSAQFYCANDSQLWIIDPLSGNRNMVADSGFRRRIASTFAGGSFCTTTTSPIPCGDILFMEFVRQDPDTMELYIVDPDYNVSRLPIDANRYTFAPNGNGPIKNYDYYLFHYIPTS